MAKSQETNELNESEASEQQDVESLVEELAGSSRRRRQQAASALASIAAKNPESLVSYGKEFVDALNRPESQTRWEALDILSKLVPYDSRTCDKAINGADLALFDEESGPLRLAAMRFLCTLGVTTENRSEKVWPLIDEGIQCYHGDLEFQDMLEAVVAFSSGKLAPSVKKALAARMKFDATNSKGTLQKRAALILENVSR